MKPSLDLSSFNAAIIDLDGTLVDTLGDFVVSIDRMLAAMSLPAVTPEFIQQTIGKGSEHLIRSVLARAGAAPDAFPQAWALYFEHYAAINGDHSALYPGVVEGLKAMQARGWKLACLTNKPGAFAEPLLRKKGIDSFFALTFGGDAFERKKPDPLPLQKTCEALGTTPSRALMVGDSSNDAKAARAAGCAVLLVDYGYNHGEPVSEVDADGVISRLDAI